MTFSGGDKTLDHCKRSTMSFYQLTCLHYNFLPTCKNTRFGQIKTFILHFQTFKPSFSVTDYINHYYLNNHYNISFITL